VVVENPPFSEGGQGDFQRDAGPYFSFPLPRGGYRWGYMLPLVKACPELVEGGARGTLPHCYPEPVEGR